MKSSLTRIAVVSQMISIRPTLLALALAFLLFLFDVAHTVPFNSYGTYQFPGINRDPAVAPAVVTNRGAAYDASHHYQSITVEGNGVDMCTKTNPPCDHLVTLDECKQASQIFKGVDHYSTANWGADLTTMCHLQSFAQGSPRDPPYHFMFNADLNDAAKSHRALAQPTLRASFRL